MAGNDVYLYQVPSDASRNDVRLRDPTTSSTGGIIGSASLVEGADALAAGAVLALSASASVTEGPDLLSSTSAIAIQSALSATENSDTLSAGAALAIQAVFSNAEGADALSSLAGLGIQADLSVSDGPDTLASGSLIAIQSSASIAEGSDALSSDAALEVLAIASITESPDVLSSGAVLSEDALDANGGRYSGIRDAIFKKRLRQKRARKALSDQAGVYPKIAAQFAARESADFIGAFGSLSVAGVSNVRESADTISVSVILGPNPEDEEMDELMMFYDNDDWQQGLAA